MAEQVNGIGLDVDNGLFEVGATLPQAGSWSIGCDVTIEDVDASVQEVRVNDISLSGSLAIPEVSVDIDANNDKVMDLEIGIATSGLSTGITESQIVPYDKIVKITEFSPESINERRFASSALAAKRIYDLIKEGGAGLNEDELKAFLKRYGYVTEEYVNELLKNASNFFYLSEDGQSIGTPYNIFSEKEISANGLGVGSGGSGSGEGGGLIRTVLTSSSLGSVTSNDNFTTFNAFAIDSIYKKVKSIEEGNVSLSNYYTKSESDARFALLSSLTTVEEKIREILSWFTIDENGNLRTEFNLYSTKEISAGGFNGTGGSTGGGLISTVLGIDKFGTVTTNSNTATFNAYAIDSLHKRIKNLEESEVDLTGYATEAWVAGQGFITSAALSPYMKTADANDTFATKTALNNLSNSHDSLATRVSTAEGNISANATAITNLGKRVTANEGNIAEILKWFAVDSDGNLYTTYNFYSTKEISANGLSIGSGGSGGGLISQVYGTTAFGTIAAESNSATFNAYAIDSLYKRIVSLEGKATAVSFVPAMTSGKQIGTLSIDGVSTVLYAPAGYAWSEVSGKPTLIESEGVAVDGSPKVNRFGLWQGKGAYWSIGHDSNYVIQAYATANGVYLRSLTGNTDSGWKRILREGDAYSKTDADSAFLKLSGGTISNGNFNPLTIKGNSTYSGIGFVRGTNSAGHLVYEGGANWSVTSENWAAGYKLIHSGNYNSYALPLSGGTISGGGSGILTINRTSETPLISFQANGTNVGFLGIDTVSRPCFVDPVYYETNYLIHSGNIGSQSVASANKLITASGSNYAYHSDSSKYAVFGISGYNCYVDGVTTYFRYGANSTIGMTINSSGNVTIGSSDLASTTSKLHVDGVITSSGASTDIGMKVKGSSYALGFIIGAGNTNRGIYDYTNNSWLLYRASNTDVLIPQGNVGIGTAAPEHKLEVRGNVAARVSDATPRSFRAENTNGTISLLTSTSRGVYDSTNSRWLIGTNGTNSFLLCGNVGIGTDAPVYKLDVNGSMNVVASGATARHIYVTNSVGKMSLHVAASGKRGLYDSTIDNWMIYTDSTSVYFPSKPLSITHAVTMSSTLSVTGLLTANSGVKVASGQALTFLDASGNEHKLTYDSTAGAFKFDGNLYATEEVSANGISTSGTIETTTNVNLSIDALMTLSGRTDVAQSTMDVYGLTTDVVYGMLVGKYNKVLGNSNTAGIWDYDCWQSNQGNVTINLKQGDGININQTIVLKQVTSGASPVWSVTFLEI